MRLHVNGRKVALCAVAASSVLALTGTASAEGTNAGPATPEDTSGNALVLPAGPNPNNYNFEIGLPPQASCAGDTATDAYHIDTFIVPSTVDPGSLTYQNGVPFDSTGTTSYVNLETSTGSPYSLMNTAPVTGQIPVPLPLFSFFRDFRTPINLPTGNYLFGVSCVSPDGLTSSYYDGSVTLTNLGTAATDTSTFTPSGVTPSTPEVPLAVALPLGALVLLGGGVLLQRRRRPATPAA